MEILNSFFSNIKDKLTNPFFGTFILLLIFHHWELWYTLFNFDSDFRLEDKILTITKYIHINLTLKSLAIDVFQAIILMFFGYLIIVGTRSLVMWVEFGLMPMITGKIVNKNVVRKSEYDDVIKEREEYFDQYEEQRKNVRIFSKTIDEQTKQIEEKDNSLLKNNSIIEQIQSRLLTTKNDLEELKEKNSKNINELSILNHSLEELKKINNDKIKQIEYFSEIFFNSKSKMFFTSPDKFPPNILAKVAELKKDNQWGTFINLGNYIKNGGVIGGVERSKMIEKGLVFERDSYENFTATGKIIWEYRNLFEFYEKYF